MSGRRRADRRRRSTLVVMAAACWTWMVASAAAPPAGASTASPSTTTPAASAPAPPPLPTVDPSLTAGQTPEALLTHALALSSVGVDDTAVLSALDRTQARLDADAVRAADAERAAAKADTAARRARETAGSAQSRYRGMATALRNAVVLLYTSGPGSLVVSPRSGPAALYAQDYAEAAIGPYGVLEQARVTERQRAAALSTAAQAQKVADTKLAQARRALADQQVQVNRLEQEVKALSASAATAVASDHIALAAQSGTNLVSSQNSLQFTPKDPLPPPVSTTSVALDWAFAELGKPYLWGGTGPDSFDCSGLTQYVWRAAGVSIPRVAADQYRWTVPVPLSDLLPGDLVFFGTTDIHHVGIYIGDGMMINAPHTGDVVRVSSIWWSDLAGFGRVHSAGTPVPARHMPSASKPAPAAVLTARGPVPSQRKPPPGAAPIASTTTTTSPVRPPHAPTTTSATSTTVEPISTTSTSAVTTVPGSSVPPGGPDASSTTSSTSSTSTTVEAPSTTAAPSS